MTLEAAGPVLAEGLRSGAKGGRPGLRRLWAAALATWCPLTWFSWALAGSIRQYSGACLQPIPPRGPTELQPKERLGSHAGLQGLGGLPLAPLPSPRAPRCFLGLLGAPWCWIPTNLGLLEVSIPVFGGVSPLFSLIFKAFTFIHVNHPTNPQPQLPNQHSICQR